MKNVATMFTGGENGNWKISSMNTIIGQPLEKVNFINISEGPLIDNKSGTWVLKGLKSNLRYTNREEKNVLDKEPSILGKESNTCAALIPLKKSAEWWLLTQDERRKIIEEESHHISIGAKYLSVVSRQLYHSRDLGEEFDFITWFEFSPKHKSTFEELLNLLRNTPEWSYVVREIDIRLEQFLLCQYLTSPLVIRIKTNIAA
jgi:chlorite dismutase